MRVYVCARPCAVCSSMYRKENTKCHRLHTEGMGIITGLVFSFTLFYVFLTSIEHLYLFYNMNKAIKIKPLKKNR